MVPAVRRPVRRNFNRNRIGKAENSKFVCATFGLLCGCGNYGNIPLFEYARYCIILGNHFNELCGYGCVYAFYGTDLYNGSDTNTAAISRKNYGGTNFDCDVWPTDRAGDLWSLI